MTARLTRLSSLFLLSLLAISACGPVSPAPASDQAGTPSASLTPTTTPSTPIGVDTSALHGIHLQIWHAFSGPALDVFTAQVARFNAVNKWGIAVSQTPQGDYSSLFDETNMALGSDAQPDLVAALPEQALSWDKSGVVVDLNPYIGDPDWGLNRTEIDDFPSAFWSQDNVNGKRLGIPAQRSARFLFYNVTWADELGFDRPPANATEFRRQACAANASFRTDADQQNDGYGGWIVDADWLTAYSWLLAFDGGVTQDGSYHFETEANQAALKFLKGMYDDSCAWMAADPDNPFAVNPGPYYNQFATRSALFISGDLGEAPRLVQTMSSLKSADQWTAIPFPGRGKTALVTYGPSYTMLASTPEKQLAAWLFVRWLLSPENQAKWAEASGLFPLRASALDLLEPYRSGHPQWEAAVEAMPQAQTVPQLASWRKVRYVLGDGMFSIFRMGVPLEKIPSVLQEMDATAEELSK